MATEHYIRCSICQRKPILAVCGSDQKTGKPFIHVKSVRGDRINAEVIVTEGSVRIRCRECLRWHTIRIVKTSVHAEAERLPESIGV